MTKMKKTGIVLLLFICISITISSKAQDYKTALGIRLSSSNAAINNSISLKYFFSQQTAVEALFSFGDPAGIGVLIEKHNDLGLQGLKWLYGGGAFVVFGGNRNVGAQGILGLDYKVPSIPFNLTLDWKPELSFSKEFSFEPSAVGISARFTLK